MNSSNSLPAALIFDMDGVLVDSNPFHLRKWIELLNEHGIPYDPKELPSQILGHRNDTAFRRFFGPDITREESRRLSEELEARFREEFKPHAKPLPGLKALIEESHRAGIPMAVASSAMTKNVEFVVDALGFRPSETRLRARSFGGLRGLLCGNRSCQARGHEVCGRRFHVSVRGAREADARRLDGHRL